MSSPSDPAGTMKRLSMSNSLYSFEYRSRAQRRRLSKGLTACDLIGQSHSDREQGDEEEAGTPAEIFLQESTDQG